MTHFTPYIIGKALPDNGAAVLGLPLSAVLGHVLRLYFTRLIESDGGFDDLNARLTGLDSQFEACFRRAQDEGHLSATHDAQALSQLTTALITNLDLRRRGGASDADLHRIAEATITFLLDGA
ncbi:hypothetical protein [Asticcacaulis benevestitus]|uniref:Uncharacterized protein n=1 Tax=Asticcacaulis benevestitus DSM 16100 = ATCC BAA-896 TaxID=1121022 RepID=V4PPD2_9CAUL|nr:hypothetical protein [Asticcacaulis benevestitus]ESQ89159.1 hypothetical protein ABENE_14390 [Asticcacaulis benevestitus DSM 16100 = ATCC BAA-896]